MSIRAVGDLYKYMRNERAANPGPGMNVFNEE